jgi:hypothetical protein
VAYTPAAGVKGGLDSDVYLSLAQLFDRHGCEKGALEFLILRRLATASITRRALARADLACFLRPSCSQSSPSAS